MFRLICAAAAIGLSALAAAPAQAQGAKCEGIVESTDDMEFITKTLEVPVSCKEFKVTLLHLGVMPEELMGHNFVLGKTEHVSRINDNGMMAGEEDEYVMPGDPLVIAHSGMIGGGESTTAIIPVDQLRRDERYTYFCSFPSHSVMMKGRLILVDDPAPAATRPAATPTRPATTRPATTRPASTRPASGRSTDRSPTGR